MTEVGDHTAHIFALFAVSFPHTLIHTHMHTLFGGAVNSVKAHEV